MNPVRMQFVREKVLEITREEHGEEAVKGGNPLQGLDILDVGCGGGLLSESLARLGAHTVGIDASESNIAIASSHASADPRLSADSSRPSSKGSLVYRHISAEEILKEQKRFDVVCSMEVLEHVDNPAGFISSCAELLKPGGHLFLSTIARTPLSYVLTILVAEHILRKVTPGTHTHSKYINPSELISFFSKYRSPSDEEGMSWITRTYEHGLPMRTEAEVRGMVYIPWKGQWMLTPRGASGWGTTHCNYLFWVRKP
ncbi:hypothetical protein PILCRDRAFT_812207 [Piloderma croceum F 1598]|uniref:3-demethylubiquinol 3-O-methyltransferase n=1 Tax=Piloderma croceum (strain F 1598) TaxID=765440 RepID=A0A0C3GII6_PILCF|nr:hypothetical protein PILCRDRAFT_812207 [Piloderma croceum F 1598]